MSFSAGSIIARASSGSSSAISSVDPLMSANSAVTVLRSPSLSAEASARSAVTRIAPAPDAAQGGMTVGADASPVIAAPQSPQNFLPAGFSAPHEAHLNGSAAPQSPQKRLPSGLSAAHCPQRIACLYYAGGKSVAYEPAAALC